MKPRIASYYDTRFGRNDGNPFYVSHVLRRDYETPGLIEFDRLVPDPAAFQDIFGGYDLNLWIDWAEDALYNQKILFYKPIPCPRPGLYWASDTHLGPEYRQQKARQFDWVCVAQKAAIEEFRAAGVTAPIEWLPHAVEPDCYNPLGMYTRTHEQREQATHATTLPKHDVSFVGYLTPKRRVFLDAFYKGVQQQGRTFWHANRFFEEAAQVYARSRVVINEAVKADVNMRVFEVLATRTFLLTPAVPTLDELFTDGVHLVTYKDGDVNDALEKFAYYADDAHADERERIAAAGYAEVLAKHTFRHRVARMLELAGIGAPGPA